MYKIVVRTKGPGLMTCKDEEQWLSKMGEDGYELVTVVQGLSGTIYYLKRTEPAGQR